MERQIAGRGEAAARSSSSATTRRSGSPRRSSSPPGRRSASAPTRCGTRPSAALREALEATGLPYELKAGDGAFYGPKIDFDVTDAIGRQWQLGTIQLDYSAPERFDLSYVGRGQPRAPAGGHPPRGERLVRALHRHPDRALRRRVSAVALAGAGARAARSPTTSRPHAGRASRPRCAPRASARTSTTARNAQLPHPRGGNDEGAVHGGDRAARGGGEHARRARARGGEEAGGRRARRVRRARDGRDPHRARSAGRRHAGAAE